MDEEEKLEIVIDDEFMVIKIGEKELKIDVSDKSEMEDRTKIYYENIVSMAYTLMGDK